MAMIPRGALALVCMGAACSRSALDEGANAGAPSAVRQPAPTPCSAEPPPFASFALPEELIPDALVASACGELTVIGTRRREPYRLPPPLWMLRFAADGERLFEIETLDPPGATFVETGVQDRNGDYLVTGAVPRHLGGLLQIADGMLLARLDATGAVRWHTEVLEGEARWGNGLAIALGPQGHVHVAGTMGGTTPCCAGWLGRFDSQGRLQWSFGRDASDAELSHLSVAADGTVFAAGHTKENIWIVALEADGRLRWEQEVSSPAPDSARAFHTALDSREPALLVAGLRSIGVGVSQPWIRKYALDGTVLWTDFGPERAAGGTARWLTMDDRGRVHVFGSEDLGPAFNACSFWLRTLSTDGEPLHTRALELACEPVYDLLFVRGSAILLLAEPPRIEVIPLDP